MRATFEGTHYLYVSAGPTQFLPGSHVMSPDDPRVVEPIHAPAATPACRPGDACVFDYRLVHRGSPNSSPIGAARSVYYVVLARPWFRDVQNFAPDTHTSLADPVALATTARDDEAAVDGPGTDDDSDEASASSKKDAMMVGVLDAAAGVSERELGALPGSGVVSGGPDFDAMRERMVLNVPDDAVEFEGLRGAAAIRALEEKCKFQYVDTVCFLREADVRNRHLLHAPPAPRAFDLGPTVQRDVAARNTARGLSVRRVETIDGLGLFATRRIEQDALVAEYAGLVRPAASYTSSCDDDDDDDVTSSSEGFDGYALDYAETLDSSPDLRLTAKHFGSLARFVNHDADLPNAKLVRARTDPAGLLRVLVVTTRVVEPGDQVLVDYGPAFWFGSRGAVVPIRLSPKKSAPDGGFKKHVFSAGPEEHSSSAQRQKAFSQQQPGVLRARSASKKITQPARAPPVSSSSPQNSGSGADEPARRSPDRVGRLAAAFVAGGLLKSATSSVRAILSDAARDLDPSVGVDLDRSTEPTKDHDALAAWNDLEGW